MLYICMLDITCIHGSIWLELDRRLTIFGNRPLGGPPVGSREGTIPYCVLVVFSALVSCYVYIC